jgi:hypothetical protein
MLEVFDKIQIDAETGMPVLPEGYFWRVGDKDVAHYWYKTDKPNMKPVVQLMKTEGVVHKTREVPVYGKQWWNKNQQVDSVTEYYTEIGGPVEVMFHQFEGETRRKEWIPDFASSRVHMLRDDEPVEWWYEIPINQQGIAFLATALWGMFTNQQEHLRAEEAIERAKLEAKEKFYGDYPPKSLNGK